MTGIIISTPPTVELPPGSSGGGPTSLPPVTYQYAVLNLPQTWTAKQTFPLGNIAINAGDISGNLPISAFNGGASATSTTFWRGDGTWAAVSGAVTSIAGNTGAFTLANGIDNSTNQIQLTAARRTLPTTQVFLSGSGTYTTPANVLLIEVELVGGGGGGAGSGTTPGNGGNGGNTTFSTLTGTGGNGAIANSSGGGGAASGGHVNKTGASGGVGSGLTSTMGGFGANSPYGGAGVGGQAGGGAGIAAAANTGSGGGGGGVNATPNGGGAGGGGGFVRAIINSPAATYSYAVGAGGTAGATGTSGAAGGAGGSGFIQVTERYGT